MDTPDTAQNSDLQEILLVDDEPSVLFALKLLLQALKFQVVDFSVPTEAITYLEAGNNCDLCICDLRMPKLNGLEVLKKAKDIRPNLPFVLMSAHATNEEVQMARDLGANDFLAKPFTPDQLHEVVDKIQPAA